MGSSALASGLGFFVSLFKIIIVFFIKAPVFAKEMGKLVQWKQDRAFQAGVIQVSQFESVFLPSLGRLSGTEGLKGSCPSPQLPPLSWPARRIAHFFLDYSARRREPSPPACVTFRSRTHSLFFIFSSKGSDIPVSQFGSPGAILSQTWRAGDIDHWLK